VAYVASCGCWGRGKVGLGAYMGVVNDMDTWGGWAYGSLGAYA